MRGHDIITLLQLLKIGGADFTFRNLAALCGLSQSQVFESIERCAEVGLLEADRKTVDKDKFLSFLSYALPYVLPSSMGGKTSGIPLSLQPLAFKSPDQAHDNIRMVWKSSEASNPVTGFEIEPFVKNLPALLARDPSLIPICSCIEILRLSSHAFQPMAREILKRELDHLTTPTNEAASVNGDGKIPEKAIDIAVCYIAKHGFKCSSFARLAPIMAIPESQLRQAFASETDFFLHVTERQRRVAGVFMGPVVLDPTLRAEVILEVMDNMLGWLESNEDFLRLVLWSYLENIPEMRAALVAPYNQFLQALASRVHELAEGLSTDEALLRAYILISSPQWYAHLLWDDSLRLSDKGIAANLRENFKTFVKTQVLTPIVSAPHILDSRN